jgi:hypothetical protein
MKNSRTRPQVARRLRSQPVLQPLEDRSVPSTVSTYKQLVDAINAANVAGGANTITLAPGTTFTLTGVDNTTDGPTGLPVIAAGDNLTITGSNDVIQRSTANKTAAFRLFDVAAGASLTLTATSGTLTLQNGLITGGVQLYAGNTAAGGAIYSQGTLSLTGVIVQNNTAQGAAGAKGVDGADAAGGGIYSTGSLTVDSCTIQNNRAIGGQGGSGHSAPFGDTTAGYGGSARGGGLFLGGGTITLRNTTVKSNSAQGGPSGGKGAGPGLGEGGGIFIRTAASATLDAFTQANTTNNTASTRGNDIYSDY